MQHAHRHSQRRLILASDERATSIADRERQLGHVIKYGDTVELEHVMTGQVLTLSKQQAFERAAKKVDMNDYSSELAVLVVKPAFKAYATGEPVMSGDLLVFTTNKLTGGMLYSLHMGWRHGQDEASIIKRSLQISNPAVIGANEVNMTTGDGRPTLWRGVLFEPFQNNIANAKLFKEHASRLKTEQVVCFYHKEGEAYLEYRMDMGNAPAFHSSNRVATKARKKASWMWKIEALCVYDAAGAIECGDVHPFRIKHVVTNRYLTQNDGELEMTDDYLAPGTQFSFRSFNKDAKEEFVKSLSLVYLRTADGMVVHQSKDYGGDDDTVQDSAAKETAVSLTPTEAMTERDALLVMPVLPASIASVVRVRRAMLVLSDFTAQLKNVPEKLMPGDAPPPVNLSEEANKVLACTAQCYDSVLATLKTLVMNATFDEDQNPMSREGAPNRLMQKLLRELNAIPTVMELVQLPFTRGICINWMLLKDARFKPLIEIISMAYRLMKQTVKNDEKNALELHRYVSVIRSHLGKGLSCTTTLKEIYVGKRKLLSLIKQDLIDLFMLLLHHIRDPRYIDFLLSICTCKGEPMVQIQQMLCETFFEKNPELLPMCKLDRTGTGVRLGIHIPGTKDENGDLWIDVASFSDSTKPPGGELASRDLASWILTAPYSDLEDKQKLLRYFVRCTNLFGRLVLGRNQTALRFLLLNEGLCFKYEDIMAVLGEPTIPALVRARFTTLMLRLYVDRDPQSSQPQVLYTRTWSKVVPEETDLAAPVADAGSSAATLPRCTTDFVDLCALLQAQLADLAGARDREGRPSLNFGPKFGQIELLSAQIETTDLLVDFGFFTSERDTLAADFSEIKKLFAAMFAIVDTERGPAPAPSKKREAQMLVELRSAALQFIVRIFNLRANYRISVALDAYERVFDAHLRESEALVESMARDAPVLQPAEEERFLEKLFKGQGGVFKDAIAACFSKSIISTDDIASDTYDVGRYRHDRVANTMIRLVGFQDLQLTRQACALLLRNMSQRSRVTEDLRKTQVLVYPAAVKVYYETQHSIARFTALKKHLAADEDAAYKEAHALLARLTGYLTLSDSTPQEIVLKNQRIMLNRELDEPVTDLLLLNLERDSSAREALSEANRAERDADPPTNVRRRDLFQACYNFLKALSKGNAQAQAKLFPQIGTFSEHMGIRELNVADTIREIVRDNGRLIAQVPESFFRHFVQAILTWGRKARWLNFFEVFLEIDGSPFKRNQDLVLRLIMEEWDMLIDLQCDYRAKSAHLPSSDPRNGKALLDLIKDGDHLMPVRSLVKYHYGSINLLALCAAGKAPANKAKIHGLVSMDRIIDAALDIVVNGAGERESLKGHDLDGVHFVRSAWVKLMTNVYLSSMDTHSITQIQGARRLWSASERGKEVSLMGQFVVDVRLLSARLDAVHAARESTSGFVSFDGRADDFGKDIGQHIKYAMEVLRALERVFGRPDIWDPDRADAAQQETAGKLREAIVELYTALHHFSMERECLRVVEVVTAMTEAGIKGTYLRVEDENDQEEPPGVQSRFHEGWRNFKLHLATKMGVSAQEGRSMERSIKDIAMMLGSRETAHNARFETLKEFVELISDTSDVDSLVQLNGLKIVRAILYVQPDKRQFSTADRDEEFEGMLQNRPPRDADPPQREFRQLQSAIAHIGGVTLVVEAMASPDRDVVLAALMLAVTLLEGGNKTVQDLFAATLAPASSQDFFLQLNKVIEDSIGALKDQKRKIKHRAAAAAALAAAGIKRNVPPLPRLGMSQQYMTEVMKTMRRFCMGQHKALQDILRKQRLNKHSINFLDEAVKYLKALEPELKASIRDGDTVTVEGAIRGFLMLSDAMRGPNHENQTTAANSGILDLGDRIFSKMQFEHPARPKGQLPAPARPAQGDSLEPRDEVWRNRLRSRLKLAVTTALLSFLEGVEDDEIPNQMLSTCQWSGMAVQMDACYRALTGPDACTVLDGDQLFEEGSNYYFLFKFLMNYDTNRTYLEPAIARFSRAAAFFEARTGYVEIKRDDRLERVYFPLPEQCVEGGALDRPFAEMFDTEREDPDKKNLEWLDNMILLIDREEYQSNVRNSWLAFTVVHWDFLCALSFWWSLLIQAVLILGAYVPLWLRDKYIEHEEEHEEHTAAEGYVRDIILPITRDATLWLSVVMLLICVTRAFAFVWAEVPNIIMVGLSGSEHSEVSEETEEKTDGASANEEEDDSEEDLFAATREPEDLELAVHSASRAEQNAEEDPHEGGGLMRLKRASAAAQIVATSAWCWYELMLIVLAILAVALREPTIAVGPLFEMCFWKGSKTVIDAIKFNAGKMIQTLILGLLVMYIWLVLGFWLLYDEHDDDMCTNMFQCFFSYFYLTMRGDGVKDVLKDPVFNHNLYDFSDPSQGHMMLRTLWDMTYQFIFLYILIAIITGIVIDAFGGLKEEREAAEADLAARCFVCHLERFTLDQKGDGFEKHLASEHNPRWYLFFLLHIKQRPVAKLTGQEDYVLKKVWPGEGRNPSYRWLPREETLTLNAEGDAEEVDALRAMGEQVASLEAKMMAHFVKVEEQLLSKGGA